ncbi:sigma-54-dependent Fis family transcriptional regulator [Thiorhodococcus mannitoliphagus]|uniref:Sigma-54-dependent Fis family transcriptional regulator n=1 Tax=Thiorhodococcus mannitoliphagus TaxID=329406 RepID=A0A6P1E3B4_9GAMM|nr:sigma-54 dependent transcriptional regulator [Thiorhodococcus mannitoliphagus]NEX22175.1 sigma-54-dependent Fis family transcriptional regulator [Thiorhodococcus mannitoliphagus]
MTRICLIEDDAIMGEALVERLTLEGFGVVWQRTGRGGLERLLAERFDLLLLDVSLPDLSGIDLFEHLRRSRTAVPPTLFITGYGSIEDAVRLLKLGAVDYLTKPLDPGELIGKLRALSQSPVTSDPPTKLEDRLGISPAMCQIEAELARLARHPQTPVLICGESGVGKEVVARRLHRLQCPRAPFVAVNCAALPEGLIEAELFGHERGAYTGAERRRAGVFEQAGDGLLFLDEIGDMPLALQSRLLRVVQSRQLTRIGGTGALEVPARLVCATHRDLAALVRAGAFREDLYYRVRVLEIRIPPLRERPEDILWLAERYVAEHVRRFPDECRELGASDRERLLKHHWPGNVRELQHALERACILGRGPSLALDLPDASTTEQGLKAHAQAGERAAILAGLTDTGFNMTLTAERLGISRKTLWQKMKRYGLERP